MKKQIGILISLAASTLGVRAAETNQIAMPPVLQPLWAGSASLGLTLACGNSDILMARK